VKIFVTYKYLYVINDSFSIFQFSVIRHKMLDTLEVVAEVSNQNKWIRKGVAYKIPREFKLDQKTPKNLIVANSGDRSGRPDC